MKLLIADDDPQLVRALRITLAAHGYDIVTAADGAAAITAAARSHPDIILLDLGMPELDGIEVIQGLRGWTSAPILVTKPFQIDELLARLRALARRAQGNADEATLAFGDVVVDLAAKAVTRGGRRVHLTPTEWRMLEQLCRNPGALVTRQDLLVRIWGSDQVTDSGYLRLYMSQLRRKLEANPGAPTHLLTESGMGYRLVL